jgi:histone acetyltransferase (RNA polymerase elongator complex component)
LYKPLTIEEVIEITAPVVQCFEESHVNILRIGLHPSEDLLKGEMVAGPWHPALRQMIYSRVWEDIFRQIMTNSGKQQLNIKVASRQYPAAVGYQRQNKLKFPDIHIQVSPHLKQMQYEIDHC